MLCRPHLMDQGPEAQRDNTAPRNTEVSPSWQLPILHAGEYEDEDQISPWTHVAKGM